MGVVAPREKKSFQKSNGSGDNVEKYGRTRQATFDNIIQHELSVLDN